MRSLGINNRFYLILLTFHEAQIVITKELYVAEPGFNFSVILGLMMCDLQHGKYNFYVLRRTIPMMHHEMPTVCTSSTLPNNMPLGEEILASLRRLWWLCPSTMFGRCGLDAGKCRFLTGCRPPHVVNINATKRCSRSDKDWQPSHPINHESCLIIFKRYSYVKVRT
jgi:hypothetical protein